MLPQLGLLEMLLVMGVAVLLFGKRLPDVGRQLGRGIIEFKKGLGSMGDEFAESSSAVSNYSSSNYGYNRKYDEKPKGDSVYSDASVPKFELPGTPSSDVPQMEYPQASPQD